MRPIRFGVIADVASTKDELVGLARRVEVLGFSILLLRDHMVAHPFGHQPGPLVAMAVLAMSTTRLRIGTMVICNDFRPPVQLAKEIATLHVVSGGRIELGLGAGFLNVEYEPLGILFDPPGVRVLAIAAREAEIVGIQTVVTTSGDVVMEPGNLLAGTMRRKVDHIREAAGSRFDAIELNTTISIELTGDRKAGARRLIAERGLHGLTVADVLEMPALLIGTHNEMADQIRQRRDRFGLSYLVVGERNVESFAPLVTALAGT